MVLCHYQRGALVGVSINTLSGNGGGPAVFSVGGKKISLPATDEEITRVLGGPLRRD
jgi:hypothetical protein